jgi:hypothetical protein
MNQAQINRAVSRATGEDFEVIERRGFSLVEEESPLDDTDIEALIVDWDKIQAEQTTSMFRDRQEPNMAA